MGETETRLRDLEAQVGELSADLRVLRGLVEQDHASALNKIRYVTEKVLHDLCARHEVSWGAKEPTLENMIGPLIAAKVIAKNIAVHVRTIQTNASPGSHFQEDALSNTHVQVAQIALLEFLEWHYQRQGTPKLAGVSQPALPVARVRSRASLKAAVIGGVLVALGAVGFVVLRSSDHAKPKPAVVLTEPKAGLAAIDRYAHQRGEGEELGSEPMWESALDDFTHANAQPNAPVRWTAGEHFARGMLALIRGEVAGAATEFRAASTADPTWAVPQGALAEVLHRQDRFDDALVAARAAQQLEPSEWTWVVTGAHVYRAWNRLDDAIREYRRALTMAPKEPLLLSELALVVHAAHLDSEADRLAHDALALDPNLAGPHIIFAERALEAHDGKTALDEATRVASLLPGSVSALLSIGDAEVLLGDATAARDAYKRAIAAWNTHKNKGASESRIAMAERDIADGVIEKRIEVERDAARSRAEVANAKTDAARKAVLAKQKAADAAKPADDMRSRAPADRKPCVCQDGDPLCSCL